MGADGQAVTTARAGMTIASRRIGSGPMPALALHCSLASGSALRPLLTALDATVSADAPDLPGHGRSGPPSAGRDYLDLCADVAESFCDRERPRVVIGHSLGAVAALCLAVRKPHLVSSLVLIEPVFFAASTDPTLSKAVRADLGEIMGAIEAGERSLAARRFTGMWGAGVPWDELPAAARTAMTDRIHLVRDSGPGLTEDSQGLLATGRLEGAAMPVLLIRGGKTQPVIADIHRALLARLPAARDVIVPNAAHMAPVTHPEETADLIRAHLD